jgi:hypothetical protein
MSVTFCVSAPERDPVLLRRGGIYRFKCIKPHGRSTGDAHLRVEVVRGRDDDGSTRAPDSSGDHEFFGIVASGDLTVGKDRPIAISIKSEVHCGIPDADVPYEKGFFVSYFERRSLVPIDDYGWCIARANEDTNPHYKIPPGASVNVLYAEWTDGFSAATATEESELPPPPKSSDADLWKQVTGLRRSPKGTLRGDPGLLDDTPSPTATVVNFPQGRPTRSDSLELYDSDGARSEATVVDVDSPRSPIKTEVADITYPMSFLHSAPNVTIVEENIGRRRKEADPKYAKFTSASEVIDAFRRLASMDEFSKRSGFTDKSYSFVSDDDRAKLKRGDVTVKSVRGTIFAAPDKGGDKTAHQVYRDFLLPLVDVKYFSGEVPEGYKVSGPVTTHFNANQQLGWDDDVPFETWRKIYELWRQRTKLESLTDDQLADLPIILAVFMSEARVFDKTTELFEHLVPRNADFASHTMIVPMNLGGISEALYKECEEDKDGSAVGYVRDQDFWITPRHLLYTRKDGEKIHIPIMGADSVCVGVGNGVSVTHRNHQFDWTADVGVVYQSPKEYTTNLNGRKVRWSLDPLSLVNMEYPLKDDEIGTEVTIDLKSYDGGGIVKITKAQPGSEVRVQRRGAHKYIGSLGLLDRQDLTVNFVRYGGSA